MFQYDNMQQEPQQIQYEEQWHLSSDYVASLDCSKQYRTISFSALLPLIDQLNKKTILYTNLSEAWNLMLLHACEFSEEQLIAQIDESKNYLHLIRYDPDYHPTQQIARCDICHQVIQVYLNSCGHKACLQCIRLYLQQQDLDLTHREIYPKCFYQLCNNNVNCLLLQLLHKESDSIKSGFDRLLSFKYLEKSKILIPCKGYSCHRIIILGESSQTDIVCDCGTRMCLKCKQEDHFPNICQDVKPANNIFYQPQPEKCLLPDQLQLYCAACNVKMQGVQENKRIRCICGDIYCWDCFDHHSLSKGLDNFNQNIYDKENEMSWLLRNEEQPISRKLTKIQNYRETIKYLYSNRIQILASRLIDRHVLYEGCEKLVEIRNTVADLYRFLINYEIGSHYHRNRFAINLYNTRYAKQFADKLYLAILRPDIDESYIIEQIIKLNKINSINFLFAEAKTFYDKLRKVIVGLLH